MSLLNRHGLKRKTVLQVESAGPRVVQTVDRWMGGWKKQTLKLEAQGILLQEAKATVEREEPAMEYRRLNPDLYLTISEALGLYDLPLGPPPAEQFQTNHKAGKPDKNTIFTEEAYLAALARMMNTGKFSESSGPGLPESFPESYNSFIGDELDQLELEFAEGVAEARETESDIMTKPTPLDKSTKQSPPAFDPYYVPSPERQAELLAKYKAKEIEDGKRLVDKNGKPVLVVDRPIDL